MILRAVRVEIAWDTAVDAAPILASKAGHTIVACVAAWRGLDATHALLGHVHALSAELARHAATAGAPTGKDALLDRYAVEVAATRLDANRTDGTVVVRLARRLGRTGATYRIGHAQGLGPDASGSSIAPIPADAASASAVPTITARISASVVSAANCEYRCEQQHSKPSISHQGLLINKFTEIFR
jgi:hypothetical protein